MKEYKTQEQKMKFYKHNAWRGKYGMRNKIYERDNGECQMCKDEGKVTTKGTKLEVHHIKEIEHHPELALEEDNLTLICVKCHNFVHNRNFRNQEPNKWEDDELGIL